MRNLAVILPVQNVLGKKAVFDFRLFSRETSGHFDEITMRIQDTPYAKINTVVASFVSTTIGAWSYED